MGRYLDRAGGVAALGLCAGISFAGQLTPPAGPVAPTPGPEPRIAMSATNTPGDADSVFKITAPGSYYLTGNLTGVAGKNGIEIVASGVIVDLMGFDLVGVAGSLDGVNGAVAGVVGVVVRNGTIRSWDEMGIDLVTNAPIDCRVDSVRSMGNGTTGIGVGQGGCVSDSLASNNIGIGILVSVYGQISQCIARNNGGAGIFLNSGCNASFCTSDLNTGIGIDTGAGCTIAHCTTYDNGGQGYDIGPGSMISRCTASFSALDGIRASSDCVIVDNSCHASGDGGDGAGIHVTSNDNRIEGNNCTNSDRGVDVDVAGNFIVRNSCSGNTSNWEIAANNVFGPIINRTAPGSAVVSGDDAPSSLGSTDANANYTY